MNTMNTREKMAAIENWLGWQDEDLSAGLRSIADAERLYDYWQARSNVLPEMADASADNPKIDVPMHRIKALGYDPLADDASSAKIVSRDKLTQQALKAAEKLLDSVAFVAKEGDTAKPLRLIRAAL